MAALRLEQITRTFNPGEPRDPHTGKWIKMRLKPSRFRKGDRIAGKVIKDPSERLGRGGNKIRYEDGSSGVFNQRMTYDVERPAH